MSQTISRFLHPFDVVQHPQLEPEVKRAILASWASDRAAVVDHPDLRKPAELETPISADDVMAALHALAVVAAEAAVMVGSGCSRQLTGSALTTAEIHYFMPDYPNLLQLFIWQAYDEAPNFPALRTFLDNWQGQIEGELHSVRVAHRRDIGPPRWRSFNAIHRSNRTNEGGFCKVGISP